MAAGLLTTAPNYNGAISTDDIVACSGASAGTTGGCQPGPPCYAGASCSLFSQLNFSPLFGQFAGSTAYQRSDNSGATDQLFAWLCHAPVVRLDFGSHATESTTGAKELEVGLSPSVGPPVATCPTDTDQVPSVGGAPHFTEVNDPNQQALKAYNATWGSGNINPQAAFADMNWAEATYFGMNVAALQKRRPGISCCRRRHRSMRRSPMPP